jgi:hypothetical protein
VVAWGFVVVLEDANSITYYYQLPGCPKFFICYCKNTWKTHIVPDTSKVASPTASCKCKQRLKFSAFRELLHIEKRVEGGA